jgi:PIN domain nuclease of toxin-antitoxin system
MNGSPRLSKTARAAIESGGAEVYVSAASALELAIKVRIGKLPEAGRLTHRLAESLAEQEFLPLPVSIEHGRLGGLLPGDHRDPFDRLLAAQSLIENIPIVTDDSALRAFGAVVVW